MIANPFKSVTSEQTLSVTALGMIHSMLVMGKENDNAYSLTEIAVSPEAGPPLHRHRELESFYILEGTFLFELDGQQIKAEAGTFVPIPSMIWHRWKTSGSELARLLCLFIPGGVEESFVEWGHPVTDVTAPPMAATPEDIQHSLEVSERYGIEFRFPS